MQWILQQIIETKKNNAEIYLTYSEGKSVIAEQFISSLKNKSKNIWVLYQEMHTLIISKSY